MLFAEPDHKLHFNNTGKVVSEPELSLELEDALIFLSQSRNGLMLLCLLLNIPRYKFTSCSYGTALYDLSDM